MQSNTREEERLILLNQTESTMTKEEKRERGQVDNERQSQAIVGTLR